MAVEFGVHGMPLQHYRADSTVAQIFATEAVQLGLAVKVTIDDLLDLATKTLPCQRLFNPSCEDVTDADRKDKQRKTYDGDRTLADRDLH
ncbi:hypothetical protein [Nocardia sp. NPDC052566]|uniref:hypothetical protein n=1 Tax=Nocardia sp. NPDC052566 TaxID=3364330 RepID=UPI0037CB1E31